jgi:hypothetical protein
VEQVSVPLLQQHGGSAHQYYNYFEGDAESGDNSHTSLPWAPGLPQHMYAHAPLLRLALRPLLAPCSSLVHTRQKRGRGRHVPLGRLPVQPRLCGHPSGLLCSLLRVLSARALFTAVPLYLARSNRVAGIVCLPQKGATCTRAFRLFIWD